MYICSKKYAIKTESSNQIHIIWHKIGFEIDKLTKIPLTQFRDVRYCRINKLISCDIITIIIIIIIYTMNSHHILLDIKFRHSIDFIMNQCND